MQLVNISLKFLLTDRYPFHLFLFLMLFLIEKKNHAICPLEFPTVCPIQ